MRQHSGDSLSNFTTNIYFLISVVKQTTEKQL